MGLYNRYILEEQLTMSLQFRKKSRLLSLDVLRGITVALMILVNSPGNQTAYLWLQHSVWNGFTLADLVFPLFIFIVGVSLAMTLSRTQLGPYTIQQLLLKILTRAMLLFSLGVLLNSFPNHFDFTSIRVFGVLQRIAICYLVASVLFLTTRISTQAIIMFALMVIYWLIMTLIPEKYDLTPEGNIVGFIDRQLFSSRHLYGKFFDPEGFLSTLPAISTALLGNLTGSWLRSSYTPIQKVEGMTLAGFLALLLGWLWGMWFPINKSLWTSSYVLWAGGLSLLLLALCYWMNEIKSLKKWSRPFEIFGLNALLAYVLHVFFLKLQAFIIIPRANGTSSNLRLLITEHLFGWTSLENASLLYAVCYTILWFAVIWLFVTKQSPRKGEIHEHNRSIP